MGTCAVSCLVRFLGSCALRRGGYNEESEEDVAKMTSWEVVSQFLLPWDRCSDSDGEGEGRKGGVFDA